MSCRWLCASSSDRLVTLRLAVRAADWDAVLAASLDALGAGRAHLLLLADLEAEGAATLGFQVERAEAFATAFRELAARDDRAAIVANARAQLSATDPALAQRLSGVLDRIEAGDTSSPNGTGVDTIALSPTEIPSDPAIAAMSRGLRGLAHHAFNTVTGPLPDLSTALATLEEFTILLNNRESLLREAQTRLFDVIKADQSREARIAKASSWPPLSSSSRLDLRPPRPA